MIHEGVRISWLGHATLRLEAAETVVYIDPGRCGVDGYEGGDADIVCVTHGHHYDPDGIRRVANADATLLFFEGIDTGRIERDVERPVDLPLEVRTVDAEADLAIGDAIVRTTAAYNDPDGPHVRADGRPFHPKGRGCGFSVTLEGVSVYSPGDTDVLAGHEHLSVDVFCPPIGGVSTMDRHEAAALAVALDPDLVVPIHDGTVSTDADAEAFASELRERGVDVHLDP